MISLTCINGTDQRVMSGFADHGGAPFEHATAGVEGIAPQLCGTGAGIEVAVAIIVVFGRHGGENIDKESIRLKCLAYSAHVILHPGLKGMWQPAVAEGFATLVILNSLNV